ncbi:MAG: class I SAM-dependent methyltransferase [Actinomycetota bacterium]
MYEYTAFRNVASKNLIQERFEVPTLVRALDVPCGRRMLEIGCGRGVALAPLAARCQPVRLVGIDIDESLLAFADENLLRAGVEAELLQADVRALPFAEASFDVVLDFGTVYHVDRAAHALNEIARVLSPGGLFLHETRLAQLSAHPIRSLARRVPWSAAPELQPARSAVFWASRVKAG